MARGLLILLFFLIGIHLSLCQTREPKTPQMSGFQPAYGSPNQQVNTPQYQQPFVPVQMGGTANGIMNRQNRYINQAHGYQPQQSDVAPYSPSEYNFNHPYNRSKPALQQEELRGMFGTSRISSSIQNLTPKNFTEKSKSFDDALHSLKDMLSGKRKLSVSDAYFIMENAYGENYLSYSEYKKVLKQSCDFIIKWMVQNNLNPKDNLSLHYALQKFISEKERITEKKIAKDNKPEFTTITHDPFFYDFIDNSGEKDHRDFYVTKCLATGCGQCNSMSTLYLCLAEGIGAKTYQTFTPQHALVKYPDGNGSLRNYEVTSNWDITDTWYLDNMFVSRTAQKNGLYLAPFDSKQIIANIVLDLAFAYQRRFGAVDGKFVTDCINTAKPHFPKNNNIYLYLTYSNLYGSQIGKILKSKGITNANDLYKIPEALKLFQLWKNNETTIDSLGYEETPAGMYDEMLKHDEFRGRLQTDKKITGKEKHDMFTIMSKK